MWKGTLRDAPMCLIISLFVFLPDLMIDQIFSVGFARKRIDTDLGKYEQRSVVLQTYQKLYYVCYLRGVTVDSTKLETMLRKSHDSTEGLIVQNNEVNSHCITVACLHTDVQPGSWKLWWLRWRRDWVYWCSRSGRSGHRTCWVLPVSSTPVILTNSLQSASSQIYTVFRKKHALTFSFISPLVMSRFKRKLQ